MPRLMKGMFRRKGSTSYYTRLRVNGRDRWMSLGADYEEACRKLRRLRSEEEAPTARITLKQAADQFFESYIKTRRRVEDHQMTQQRLDKYLLEFFGNPPLAKLTKEHVRSYRLWLERGGRLKPVTVKHILSDLRCLLNWAVDSDLLDKSPFPRRIMPRLQEQPPKRLTDEEYQAVMALPDHYGFIARFGLGTGLRWGELIRAQAGDIQNGCLVVHNTKSGRMRRIPLSSELLAELRFRVGRLMPLINPHGFAIQVRRLTGITRFHAHMMRHTYACRMLEARVPLAAVQQLLGHSTVTMTQRYARISDEMVQREVERAYSSGML